MMKLNDGYVKNVPGDARGPGCRTPGGGTGFLTTQKREKTMGTKNSSKQRLIIMVLVGFLAWTIVGYQFSLQAQDEDPIHHYIILVKAKIRGISDQDKIDQYMKIIRTALNTNFFLSQTREEIKFRENLDTASLVFFQFSVPEELKDQKILRGDYFHTSEDLVAFNNLSNVEDKIRQFMRENEGNFKVRPVSPLDMAENTVFPYLCGQYQLYNWTGVDQKVDQIILISISDKKVRCDNFADPEDKRKFEHWEKDFSQYFKKEPLNKYIYNITTGVVDWVEGDRDETNTYFEYYKIIPQINKNTLVDFDLQPSLTRAAKRSVDGQVILSWRGSSGINYAMDNHHRFLQWAFTPGERNNYVWKLLEKEDETHDPIRIPAAKAPQGLPIQISNEITVPSSYTVPAKINDTRGKFLGAVSFRGVIDIDSLPAGLKYPFKYRYYTPIKEVNYFSNPAEETITDDSLIEYLKDKSFCDKVIRFIKANEIPNPYSSLEELEAKGITAIDAATVLKVRKLIAAEKKIRLRNLFIMILVGLAAAGLVTLLTLRHKRSPKIDIAVAKDNKNTIQCDLSIPNQEKQPVALFEIQNLRKFLSPKQAAGKFDLTMTFKIEHGLKEGDILVYNLAELFTITNFQGDKEYFMTREADTLKVDLPDACAGDKFRLVLHPQEIKDLTTPQIETKPVAFTVTLVAIRAVFKKNGKEVPLERERTWEPQMFKLTLIPQRHTPGVSLEPVPVEHQTPLAFDPGTGNYSLPYSAHHPLRKLFKITVLNRNILAFSETLQGKITGTAFEKNLPIREGIIFFLDRNEASAHTMVHLLKGYELSLRERGREVIYCYLEFPGLKENPLEPRIFQLRFYFDDTPIDNGHVNLTVTRSIEKTEALILLSDQGHPAVCEKDGHIEVNNDNEVVIHEQSPDHLEWRTRVSLPDPKLIKEYEPTELFTLHLRNGCRTHSGYYQWQLGNIQALRNESLKYDDRYEGEIITIAPPKKSGRLADDSNAKEEITFSLNAGKEKLNLAGYRLSFEVTFTLFIELIPEGKSLKAVPKKQLDVVFTCEGIHEVIPNYLVVDFGTSAIAAANSEFTLGPDSEKATNLLELKSSDSQLPSENGLLPSILSLNEDTVIESQEFVSLPARKRTIFNKPDLILTSIKLLILESGGEISLPAGFQYIDHRHNPVKGGNIKLESLLKSAYKQLKHVYIDTRNVDYKKLIFTCPNVYTRSHKRFLSDLLAEVFIRPGEGVYKENIELVSESDAVLYFYLKKRAAEEIQPGKEDIVIFDIGGGTMDITLAAAEWEKDKNYPAAVSVKKRDGVALAGEVLDKAIALQVHSILKEYENRVGKAGTETGSRPGDDLDPGKIFKAEEETHTAAENNLQTAAVHDHAIDSGQNLPEQSRFLSYRCIAGDGRLIDEKYPTDFIPLMFNFKYEHILQFKKEMFYSNDEDDIKICLGKNSSSEIIWIGELIKGKIPLDFGVEGVMFHSYLQNNNGILYLYLKKSEWLELPYLKKFESLFKEKIKRFFNAIDECIQENITIILSGRTSLWPSIPKVIREVFNHEPVDIWQKDPAERALDLKRSVIEGALQKVFYWPQITYDSVKASGVPAVNYQNRPNYWLCKPLSAKEPVEIDLNNSPFFQLGIQTDLAFTPFMNCNHLTRHHYCKKMFSIRIHTKESDNETGYDFHIESDRFPESFCKVVPEPKSGGVSSENRGLWPIKSIQLPEVKPEEFNEHN